MASFRIRPVDSTQDPLRGTARQVMEWLGKPIDEAKMRRVKAETLSAARNGIGLDEIAPPIVQTSIFNCTRFAFINGMAAAIRARVSIDFDTFEKEIKSAQRGRDLLDIDPVAEVLARNGIIGEQRTFRNPILAAEALFAESAFFVYIDNDYRPIPHSLAVVPIASPTEERFAAKLDSLTGNINCIGLDDFIRINLEFMHQYPFAAVYRVLLSGASEQR